MTHSFFFDITARAPFTTTRKSLTMQRRVFVTILALMLYGAYALYLQPMENAIRNQQAAGQLANDAARAGEAVRAASLDPTPTVFTVGLVALLLVLWGAPLGRSLDYWRTRSAKLVIIAGLGALLLSACGGAMRAEVKTIQANQTAFLIPISTDASKQTQLQSVEFLKNRQVAVKQVVIPFEWRQTGTGAANTATGDWYPTLKLLLVDRSMVTREWTKATNTGTTATDQAFGVESSESVDFKIGATCTAIIEESDAAAYLYYYAEKPLSEVMDQNIRGFIQQELFNEFASIPVEQGQRSKKQIFESIRSKMVSTFKERGVTILSFGGSEGMTYTDPKIQAAISDNYAAQQKVVQAQALATQQSFDNARIVSQANAQATATVIAGAAASEVMRKNGEMLQSYPGLTAYTLAQKSSGQVPQILVLGGGADSSSLPFSFLIQPPMPTATPAAR